MTRANAGNFMFAYRMEVSQQTRLRERGTALTHDNHIITRAEVDIFPGGGPSRRDQTERVELASNASGLS